MQEEKPVFVTNAISDQAAKSPKARVAVPSEQAVKDAKHWVDENEK